MRLKKNLTKQEFETLKRLLSPRAKFQILYEVMVNGRTQADVAKDFSISRKSVSKSVDKAYKMHLSHGERPEGWVVINIALPKDMVGLVMSLAHREREKIQNLRKGNVDEN